MRVQQGSTIMCGSCRKLLRIMAVVGVTYQEQDASIQRSFSTDAHKVSALEKCVFLAMSVLEQFTVETPPWMKASWILI